MLWAGNDTVSAGPLSPSGSDWTEDIPDCDHVRFFRSTDWSSSRVGALQLWGNALRLYTYQLLADSRPAIIYWSVSGLDPTLAMDCTWSDNSARGPAKVAIYNEAFVPLAGKAHPSLMGARFEDAFSEIWSAIKPVFDGAEATKKAADVVEIPLMVERSGFVEETFFTGNFNPLRGDDCRVGGFYNALTEVTRQKMTDRRTDMLNLIPISSEEHTSTTIGTHIMKCLGTNPYDIPFALLYQTDGQAVSIDSPASEPGPSLRPGVLHIRGSIGIPEGHRLFSSQGSLDSDEGLLPLLRNSTSGPITVPAGEELSGIEWAGYGEPSNFISAMPLSNAGRLYGYLVVGTNPRRPIDADHDHFIRSLATQISSAIAIVINTEALNKHRHRLEDRLAASERHMRYMAEHLEIGLEHLTLDGEVLWANDHYYKLIDTKPGPESGQMILPFKNNVLEEDRDKMYRAWKAVVTGVKAQTMEIRIKTLFHAPNGPPVPATVLISAFPYVENGEVKSIMSCMTDVSRLKWAEAWQARAAREAQEAKRQQSEFTDAISHEVRNPLGAILLLAEGISKSSDESKGRCSESVENCMQVIRENVEAANTILVCARHQKRIVDDVLTLSKMDFMLMTLCPSAVQPPELVDNALKILGANLTSAAITLNIRANESIQNLGVDWISCDPLRVTQILINLLSNAIKFTRQEARRQITLEYGASLSDPRKSFSQDIFWAMSKRDLTEDVTLGEEWGSGEQLYLTFSVSDTGPGMTDQERSLLFNRFQQASPKTSIKYGGTGLGLYLSHSLTEKQGGSIGLSSQPGQGCTFAFYIKVRRSTFASTSPSEPYHHVDPSFVGQEIEDTVAMARALDIKPRRASVPDGDVVYHILLVEDNLVNQRILHKTLTKAGCAVYLANHGLEALEALRSSRFWEGKSNSGDPLDVVLMDLEMPIMDGLTAANEIRALEKQKKLTGHVEIIAVTANVRQEQVKQALDAGIDAVMPKPFLMSDLLETIRKRLGR